MNPNPQTKGDQAPAHPVPRFLVKELQGTLNWAILFALLLLLLVFHLFWSLVQRLIVLSEGLDAPSPAMLAGVAAGLALVFLIFLWATVRMVKYLASILRLREDSPMTAAEEALLQQRRLWIALAVVTLWGVLGSAALMPSEIEAAKARAAEHAYWDGVVEKLQQER